MDLLNKLPDELQWNVFKFSTHPIVEIIYKEWNHHNFKSLYNGLFCNNLIEFLYYSRRNYKSRCRKKPKHCDLMKEYIKEYKWYVDFYRKNYKDLKPSPFYKWVAREIRHTKDMFTDDECDDSNDLDD